MQPRWKVGGFLNCATEKHVRIGGLELCWDQSANEKRTLRTIATEVKGETLNSTANSPFDYISYQMQSKTWRRKWQIPTPVFLPGKFHGQRSLAGSSPWGHKESDTTEPQMRARTHTHTHTHTVKPDFSGIFMCLQVLLESFLVVVFYQKSTGGSPQVMDLCA